MTRDNGSASSEEIFRILTLDGGGSKGFYTLGVLKEVEAMVGKPLANTFDLIFGTSTGAIIAAMLALGYEIDKIHSLYENELTKIMGCFTPRGKTKALKKLTEDEFEELTFEDVKTGLGIVATNWDFERPLIFKSAIELAYGRRDTFLPGFGCTIAEAVQASCAAYPFFKRLKITTKKGDELELGDGGFCANNPTLFAIADAIKALRKDRKNLRVLSVGVGGYPKAKRWNPLGFLGKLPTARLAEKTYSVNTCTMNQLRELLFKDVDTIRINETYDRPELATDFLEKDLNKLNKLFQRGRDSYSKQEVKIRNALGISIPS